VTDSVDQIPVVLGRIETKLDRALEDVEDHEKRLRRVERRQAAMSGASATLGALIGAVGSHFLIGH
jgi:hypothetical protein